MKFGKDENQDNAGRNRDGARYRREWRSVMQRLNFSLFNRLPLILQDSAAECGLACLAMIAAWHGHNSDMSELRRKHDLSFSGMNAEHLKQMAAHLGLSARVAKCSLDDLRNIKLPCMIHWGMSHMVVLKRIGRKHAVLHNPNHGLVWADRKMLSENFSGIVVDLTPTKEFKKKPAVRPLKLLDLIVLGREFFDSFSMGVVMTFVARLCMLGAPFYMQILIDEVLLKGDVSLSNILFIAFAIIALFHAVSSIVRDLTFQFLSQSLSFGMMARVFNRLVRLPTSYFSNRHLGDIQQRMQSLHQINGFLTAMAPMAIMDGFFIPILLAIMFYYNSILSWVVLGCLALLVIWKACIFRAMLRAASGLIVAETREQTHLLETIRGMMSIKTLGIENSREEVWQHRYSNRINANIKVGNIAIIDKTVEVLTTGLMYVCMIYMAGSQALDGIMSIGMITAFMVYRKQLEASVLVLVDAAVEYRLLQVPLGRVADIVFTRMDPEREDGGRNKNYRGSLKLKNIYFSYGSGDYSKMVLKGANLSMDTGDRAVICGMSGQGKSTLLKVASGIREDYRGDALYDGRSLRKWGRDTLKGQVCSAPQGAILFNGTLAENIGIIDDSIDMDKVRHVARLACVDEDIEDFPMGYETVVGDMGSMLSAGQIQRAIIARALYTSPKLLILDEATSELDHDTETRIYSNLFELGITILASAHRPETIARFPTVYQMQNGILKKLEGQSGQQANTVIKDGHGKDGVDP